MDKELFETINQCKSLTEMAKVIFNSPYYNGRVAKRLNEYLKENGINAQEIFERNKKEKRYCLHCGKELINGQNKFCSQSCSASYNNHYRKLTEKTKDKISKSLLKHYEDKGVYHERYSNGDIKRKFEHKCVVCGKVYNSVKKYSYHCSPKCAANDPKVKEKLRQKQYKLIEEGKHVGWKTRNIKSYAERFWERVLDNHKIPYNRECHENGKYFLDFRIEKNGKIIDLEIDGKQHRYKERVESDKKRDHYLTNLGYVVYRIEWNEINTDKGKKMMEAKINAFVNFYTSL